VAKFHPPEEASLVRSTPSDWQSDSMTHSRGKSAFILIVLGLLYALAGRIAVFLAFESAYASVWPATGLAIGAMVLWGYWVWPFIAGAAFLTILNASGYLLAAFATSIADTLEAVVATFLVRRFVSRRNPFVHARDLFKFIVLAAVLSPMVSAVIGTVAGIIRGFHGGPYLYVLFTWWLQNLLGVLLVAPIVLSWGLEFPKKWPSRAQAVEAALLFGLLSMTAQWVFGGGIPIAVKDYPLEYLCIPYLVWSAFRFGGKGASLALLVLSMIAIVGTRQGYGPFFRSNREHESLHLLQLYIGTNAIFTLALAAIVAERELIQRKLAHSNAELERFAYVASHDLQEPLRTVTSFCQLLKKRYENQLDSTANEYIEMAVDGSKRMYVLINSLLEYSRLGRHPEWQSTDCNDVLTQAVANLTAAITETNAEITHSELPVVPSDPSLLMPVFQNLIGNAIKFRDRHPPCIRVSAEARRHDWIFTIEDNGRGIEPRYFKQIFGLFQRVNSPDCPSGTGVGLAVCKKIVEQHGGTIWVDSTPGQGSQFHFTLPNQSSKTA
jgi:signal transduction histidine kinase